MEKVDVFVSAVVRLHNSAERVEHLLGELHPLLAANYQNFEIVLVDDASGDGTIARVETLLPRFSCVRLIPLSREVGTETALTAGLEAAIGDFVVTLEPEFDPPGELLAMVEQARRGADIVAGVTDTVTGRSLPYRALRALFYRLARFFLGTDLIRGATFYRVLSRQAVNALTRIRARRRYFALLVSEIGYGLKTHPYQRRLPADHSPDLSLIEALRLGSSVLIHNTLAPLRLVAVVGVVGSLLSLLYGCYALVVFLLKRDVMPGWTTLSIQSSGLFFLLFVMLALIGEYVGRVLEETMSRPRYHLRGELTSTQMLAVQGQRNVLSSSLAGPDPRPSAGADAVGSTAAAGPTAASATGAADATPAASTPSAP